MVMSGRRMALATFSALAAVSVFTAPANATVFNQEISVQPYAHITEDGSVTLSGTYLCEGSSPRGAVQVKATVVQEGLRLTVAAGDARCDGERHRWEARGSVRFTPGLHAGRAEAVAQLQEVHFSGLMPRSIDTLAEDGKNIEVFDHR